MALRTGNLVAGSAGSTTECSDQTGSCRRCGAGRRCNGK